MPEPKLSYEQIQQKIAEMDLKERLKKEAIELDLIEQEKAVKLAGSAALRKKRQEEEYFQSKCTHRKENGRTRVVGIFGSDRSKGALYICQNCQKEFDGTTLSPDLAPPGNQVGGVLQGFVG